MIDEGPLLQKKFSELLLWERVKRREKVLISVFFYSVLASFISLPLNGLLPSWFTPLSLLPVFFLLLAPTFFLLHPWGGRESLRTIFHLDKALHLEERAITAWEILGRREKKAADLLVLEEAGEKLRGVDPRELFKRRLTWHALLAPPLLLLWLLLVWLDIGVHFERGAEGSPPISVAKKLKEFVQEIKEKAKVEPLTESLKVAHALEEVAEKNLRGEMSEKELSENLSGMASKIGDMSPVAAEGSDLLFSKATTREGLLDLKAEMETLKHTLTLPDSAMREGKLGPEILGRLGALPRLREEVEKNLLSIEELGEREFHRFLDKLEKGVGAELDHRTLLEIREFLDLLLKGLEGRGTQETVRGAGQAEQRWLLQAERSREKGSLPGDRPGTKGQPPQAPPPFKARAATHLKGLLGEGRSGSLILRGEPTGRESEISQEDVLTSYRLQMEEELSSERIPEGLKEA
ncbi:MAG: hypothetical protein ACE5JO_00195, partial [Candidatus Binatia bacterium]